MARSWRFKQAHEIRKSYSWAFSLGHWTWLSLLFHILKRKKVANRRVRTYLRFSTSYFNLCSQKPWDSEDHGVGGRKRNGEAGSWDPNPKNVNQLMYQRFYVLFFFFQILNYLKKYVFGGRAIYVKLHQDTQMKIFDGHNQWTFT